ncbi:hypothetical protein DER45DRAFT_309726 [Fusarium avenaceum]|nr:hypothetical protein DER45DRAFT_309726 [Fusarium avenaceum]
MANANQIGSTTHFSRVKAVRRKTAEACERCREKRIKCNGLQPCQQCISKEAHCVFACAPSIVPNGNEAILEKLELVLSRLDKIESEVSQQAHTLSNLSRGVLQPDVKQRQQPVERRSGGIAQFNQETGCFEYYGQLNYTRCRIIQRHSHRPTRSRSNVSNFHCFPSRQKTEATRGWP